MRRRYREAALAGAPQPRALYVESRGQPTVRQATAEQYAEIARLREQGYLRVVVGPNRRQRRAARQRG